MDTLTQQSIFLIIQINNFWGDPSGISAITATLEAADRIINSGINGLAGLTNVWITHHEGTHSIPPVITIDDVPSDVPVNAYSDPAIPDVIHDTVTPPAMIVTE